jgi:predicted nucleic acid-binding protein
VPDLPTALALSAPEYATLTDGRDPGIALGRGVLLIEMKVLLDTNLWRRVVDAGALQSLRSTARSSNAEIQIAPAVVYEMLRTPNHALRKRLVKAVTFGWWTRLMTDVFEESQDLLSVLRRRREGWLRDESDLARFHALRADWAGGRGFWWRARKNPKQESDYLMSLEGDVLSAARAEATERRASMRHLQFDSVSLTGWNARPRGVIPGWRGDDIEPWRLDAANIWWRALVARPDQPQLDWLGPFIYVQAVSRAHADWNRLWFYEVTRAELPREWARWAVMFLQGLRKVTPGTPADNQIAVYAYDTDLFVSGDGAFVDIVNKVRPEAPAPWAPAHRADPSRDPVEAVRDAIQAEEARSS